MARHTVAERREQLIALGRELFSRQPYDAVSMDDIAQAAGISKGLLYHYFPGKHDYYVATVQSLADELLGLLAFDAGAPPEDAVEATLQRFLDFIEARAAMYHALLRGGVGMDAEVHSVVERVRQTVITRIRELTGLSDDAVTRLRLHGWLGYVEHTSLVWLAEHPMDRKGLVRLWLREFVGLAAP